MAKTTPNLDDLYVVLRSWAVAKQMHTYTDLSREYQTQTGDWFEPHGSWDAWLGAVNQRLHAAIKAPALSALVILNEAKEPGGGFWGSAPSVEAAAKEVEYGDRIARKIGRANEMGVNERFEIFFEELGLPIGAGEDAVFRSRNISAHGGKSDRPHQDLVMLGAGYRTLLNRVILKVLGFKGEYIDYSVVGHPARGIDEPIGYQPKEG